MLTVAICDDENYFAEHLQENVSMYLNDKNICAQITRFSSGEKLLNTGQIYDIILLDMKMPGRNGIEIAKQLRERGKDCQIIFITSYSEYAVEAFGVDALHYLLKPLSKADLFRAFDRALQNISQKDDKTLTITRGNHVEIIPIRHILYCESVDHRLYIHTSEAVHECFGTLESIKGELDERFFSCHRSYIVNMSYVVSKEENMVTVLGGDKILISRRRQKEFTEQLFKFLRKEVL